MSHSKYTEEEVALLTPYVTNVNGRVFVVQNLQGILGAVFARYSRAKGDFRDILLKEFIKEGQLDPKKAADLIERVLIAFGDDSVGELEGCAASFTTSMLASKELEDRRIGGSPIEKSTRYVFFDQKDENGMYKYVVPTEIRGTHLEQKYIAIKQFVFDGYCKLIDPMQAFYRAQKSLEDAEYDIGNTGTKRRYADLSDPEEQKQFRNTYNSDIRTKACDTLRALLPLSTLTNVGIAGNGRFFQWAISHCLSSPIAEVREIGQEAFDELSKVIPKYVQRAAANSYTIETNASLAALAKEIFANIPPMTPKVANVPELSLLDRGEQATAQALQNLVTEQGVSGITAEAIHALKNREEDLLIFATALYPHLHHSLTQIREVLRLVSQDVLARIEKALLGKRRTRRDRPGRALEASYPFTFDACTDFGTYKDLQRHRMTTQVRQQFTPTLGFVMPPDLVAAGFEKEVLEINAQINELHQALAAEFPHIAGYATLHGSLVRWSMGINDRSLMHLVELRSTPQGHPSYRKVAQEMHRLVTARSEWRGKAMCHVDHNDYNGWARGDSEAKQQAKLAALETKGA